MPGNILIDDVSADWISGAIQVVLQIDLSTSRNIIPVPANDDSGAYLNGASEVLRATVTQRAGRISVQAAITDDTTQKERRVIDAHGAAAAGILPVLNELAKRVDASASPFSTKSTRALQALVKAASSPKPQDRIAPLTDAISIDPSFGLAYIMATDEAAQVAPQTLPALLQTGAAHKASFTVFDRARFDALLARYSHAPLAQQEAAYRAVLEIAPNQTDALAAAGSLSFLRGDSTDGTRYFQRALELDPGSANVRRALADGLFETRRFSEAEKLLIGMDNNIAVLPELAICVLLEGDQARADAIAGRLFESIENPDARTLFRAVWLKLSGQSQKAFALLSGANFAQPAIHAIAYSELSVWHMMANDFIAARQLAAKAQQLDPRSNSVASITALVATANGPTDQFRREVEASFVSRNNEAGKNLVLGYGLFLGAHYEDAAQVWQSILQRSGGTDLRARTMLAACFMRQGKTDQARQIKVEPFVPDFADLYASVSFFELNRDLGISVR